MTPGQFAQPSRSPTRRATWCRESAGRAPARRVATGGASTLRLPQSVHDHLERARQLRHESAQANSAAASETRRAALQLREQGLPVRDIGQALGVSYQHLMAIAARWPQPRL
ncbi:MAG: helix-turn-helix domain-containing protein [Egibacteraceae bacterium]